MSLPEFSSAPIEAVASVSITTSRSGWLSTSFCVLISSMSFCVSPSLEKRLTFTGSTISGTSSSGLTEMLAIGLEALLDSVAAFTGLIDDAALDDLAVEEIDAPGHAHGGVYGEETLARARRPADHRAAALGQVAVDNIAVLESGCIEVGPGKRAEQRLGRFGRPQRRREQQLVELLLGTAGLLLPVSDAALLRHVFPVQSEIEDADRQGLRLETGAAQKRTLSADVVVVVADDDVRAGQVLIKAVLPVFGAAGVGRCGKAPGADGVDILLALDQDD